MMGKTRMLGRGRGPQVTSMPARAMPGEALAVLPPPLLQIKRLQSSAGTTDGLCHVPGTPFKCLDRGQEAVKGSGISFAFRPSPAPVSPQKSLHKLRSPHGGTTDGSAAPSRWRCGARCLPGRPGAVPGPGRTLRIASPRTG